MAIKDAQTAGYQRWSRDEFDYFMKTEVYAKDRYKTVATGANVTNASNDLPVSLLVMPNGFVQLHGRWEHGAIARNEVMFTLPLYIQLTAVIQVWKLGDSTQDLVTENIKVEGNEVRATKAIANDSDTWGFSGNLLVPHSEAL